MVNYVQVALASPDYYYYLRVAIVTASKLKLARGRADKASREQGLGFQGARCLRLTGAGGGFGLRLHFPGNRELALLIWKNVRYLQSEFR